MYDGYTTDRDIMIFWIFVALIVLAPLAITFAVPIRHIPLYLAWLAMIFTMILLFPSGNDHSSPLAGTSKAAVFFFSISFAVAITFKVLFWAYGTAPWSEAEQGHGTDAPKSMAFNFMMSATGAFAGLFVVCLLAVFAAALRPAATVHAVEAGMAIALAGFAPFLARWSGLAAPGRCFATALRWSIVIFAIGATVWIWHGIGRVATGAETIANNKPYCIQVVANHGYERAMSRLDFSPLTMRTKCYWGRCFQNHAILVVANGATPMFWNWSYRKEDFVRLVLNGRAKPPSVLCQPRLHFARDLPVF